MQYDKKFKKKNHTIRRLILFIILFGIICGCYIIYVNYPTLYAYYLEAQDAIRETTSKAFKMSESSYIYDSKGNVLAKLQADAESKYIYYDDIPDYVKNAFVAIEDRTFWTNKGVDFKGITRVIIDYIKSDGTKKHGASTITQQLARNKFLSHEVTLERKEKEIFYAYFLNQKYSKEQILEFYINDIYFANSYYGIEAAAQGYFRKSVKELSLSQIAYLCAIPNSPSHYDPYIHPDNAIARRDKILQDMLSLQYISQKEYDVAIAEEILVEPKETYQFDNYAATYAIHCATEYLMELDGFKFRYAFENNDMYKKYMNDYADAYNYANGLLYKDGYRIYTSINSKKQEKMQQNLDNVLAFDQEIDESSRMYAFQGAITVVNNKNHKVVAIVGGRTQEGINNYGLNRAFQSYRQPGSAIKPLIVYAPALENGYSTTSAIPNIDVEKAKTNPYVDQLGGKKIVMRSALEQSLNGVAWYLFSKIGPETGISYLQKMGFNNIVPDDYNPASALGGMTYGVTTVEMAAAYSGLGNHGLYYKPTCITQLIDDSGTDLYKDPSKIQIYEESVADDVVDMMKGVLTSGTAKGLKWYSSSETEAACKTGTTNGGKDGWLCGVTPYYSVSVWVGYDTPRSLDSLYGSTYPGQIWKACMLDMIDGKDTVTFSRQSDEEDGTY